MKSSPIAFPADASLGRERARVAKPSRWIVNPIVDRLLRLHREDRVWHRSQAERGIERFPEIARLDRAHMLRGIALNDAFNRLVFRLHTKFPERAVSFARRIPVIGAVEALRNAPKDRPVILALMHFGPVHYVFTILLPLLAGRSVYALHAGGDTGDATATYLRRIGVVPIVNDEKALLKLARLVAEDPSCAIVFAFDHMDRKDRRGRGNVWFLGATVSVPRSLAFLADKSRAVVVTAWGESMLSKPRVVVDGPFAVDQHLERGERQDDFTEKLFRLLETRLMISPSEWTEWENSCAEEAHVTA